MRLPLTFSALCISVLMNAGNLFFYSQPDGNGGLRFAYEEEPGVWETIGEDFSFLNSDFGAWGSGKKMWNPKLYETPAGWMAVFEVTHDGTVYGVAESPDLINWKPQEYYDNKNFTSIPSINPEFHDSKVHLKGKNIKGNIIEVPDALIEDLKSYAQKKNKLKKLYSEQSKFDSLRFKGLPSIKATLKVDKENKEISPLLLGIFFEDINYAADGGLYAELIQNRDFEYKPGEGKGKNWGPLYAWETKHVKSEISQDNPVHPNNPHFIRLSLNGSDKAALINKGYDGISLKGREDYKFSLKGRSDSRLELDVKLVTPEKEIIASAQLTIEPTGEWTDSEVTLTPSQDVSGAELVIEPKGKGILDLDMISLFPANTFNNRENGLRKDLAQTLADLKPQFVRFPGGCVAHGNGIDNIYDWKGSIGSLEERKPLSNLWGYHQTRGLGYYEYFLFCEDIGAEPLPVLAAAVPCQNSSWPSRFSTDDITRYGQQGGIPMDSLDNYIQDVLDLIEYANGPVTSKWGAKRAEAGHPEPFNLKYIGIGNEDMITEVFKERFIRINKAVKEAYPEITVIGTVGPFYEGPDYEEGWRLARRENIDMVDEHYYVEPAWLIYNQDYYDDYDRDGTKVYLGEWAAHLPDRASTMETALAEALYITSLERNGDVVSMSSYAPLLAKKGHTQWRPDLIYFTNDSVKPTTDYHAMRLAGENMGNRYFNSHLSLSHNNEKITPRVASSVVKDDIAGEYIIKLVNILPVNVDMDVDLSALKDDLVSRSTVSKTVMSGRYDAVEPVIEKETISLNENNLRISLPQYSYTVVRL